MDKAQMMENFDRIVTDRRVTLVAANEHIAGCKTTPTSSVICTPSRLAVRAACAACSSGIGMDGPQ